MERRTLLHAMSVGAIAATFGSPLAHSEPVRSGRPTLRIPSDVRMRGTNIVPRPGDDTSKPSVWSAMWDVWPWDDWIQPQINDAAAVGNAVRLWGASDAITSGMLSYDTYLSRWKQMLDYCTSLGLYIYPTGGDYPNAHLPTTQSQAIPIWRAWANLLADYPNVIGVDVINEAWAGPARHGQDYNSSVAQIRALSEIVRAQGLPVTSSATVNESWGTNIVTGYPNDPITPFMDACDFLDFHIYVKLTHAQVSSAYNLAWAKGKPMIFGEFGVNMTEDSAARTAFYETVRGLITAANSHVGGFAWATYDLDTTKANQYGLYWVPRVLRGDIATPFATFPTTR